MMQTANMRLGHAQRSHDKFINKVRKDVEESVRSEAAAFAGAINDEANELRFGRDALQSAIDAGQAGLAKEEAGPHPVDAWNSPEHSKRAELRAHISLALGQLKRSAMHETFLVRES